MPFFDEFLDIAPGGIIAQGLAERGTREERRGIRQQNILESLLQGSLANDPLLQMVLSGAVQGRPFNPEELFKQGSQEIGAIADTRQIQSQQNLAALGFGPAQFRFANTLINRARDVQLDALDRLLQGATIGARGATQLQNAQARAQNVLGFQAARVGGVS